jgi:hypothetical protein
VAVRGRPLKIGTAPQMVAFVYGSPPLFAGIAVKLLSIGELIIVTARRTMGPLPASGYR